MRKLILSNGFSPGDIVMLTAAVRDLHYWYPGRYLTDVQTACPQLWENNPHITPLSERDPEVELIDSRPVPAGSGTRSVVAVRVVESACR